VEWLVRLIPLRDARKKFITLPAERPLSAETFKRFDLTTSKNREKQGEQIVKTIDMTYIDALLADASYVVVSGRARVAQPTIGWESSTDRSNLMTTRNMA
jgi:hypothetical protein